jgi:hypothetical protein
MTLRLAEHVPENNVSGAAIRKDDGLPDSVPLKKDHFI